MAQLSERQKPALPQKSLIWYNQSGLLQCKLMDSTRYRKVHLGARNLGLSSALGSTRRKSSCTLKLARKVALIACPACGAASGRFGYEISERLWRHGDTMFAPTYVHCKHLKNRCPECGVKQVSRPTLLFEGYAMLILPDMPVAKAAKLLRRDEKTLTSILRYCVNKAVDAQDLNEVSAIAVAETSIKRGHKYVTLSIDTAKRAVILQNH
jgi:predicted RNA-binding Zn-ribbon protein involved in translation (DUF1610 family)